MHPNITLKHHFDVYMLCIKAHNKLKIETFCFICISFGFVLIAVKTMLNHKRVYLRFVAAQLRAVASLGGMGALASGVTILGRYHFMMTTVYN